MEDHFINNEKFKRLSDDYQNLVFLYQEHILRTTVLPYYPDDINKYREYYEDIKLQINRYINELSKQEVIHDTEIK